MKELVRSNDPVFISWLMATLEDAGIPTLLFDQHMSVVEGSLGILPRRLLVPDDSLDAAKAIMEAGPEQGVVEGMVIDKVAATADSLLGGKIVFYQPAEGYRAVPRGMTIPDWMSPETEIKYSPPPVRGSRPLRPGGRSPVPGPR